MLCDKQALPRGRWSQLPPIPQLGQTWTWTNFNTACGAKPASAFPFPLCNHFSCACGVAWFLGMMAACLACSCSWGGAVPSICCLGDECLLHSATAWTLSSGCHPHQRPGAGGGHRGWSQRVAKLPRQCGTGDCSGILSQVDQDSFTSRKNSF